MVVGTPGRLCELMKAGELRLDQCQAVVMDEVDVLLGDASLFREQVEHVILQLCQDPNSSFRYMNPQLLTLLIHLILTVVMAFIVNAQHESGKW